MAGLPQHRRLWSSRLFWKLLLACAGLNLLVAGVIGLILSDWSQRQISEQVDHRLRNAALLVRDELSEQVPAGRSEKLQRLVRRLGQDSGTRFTLVALDGTVLADSEFATLAEVAQMDNHRDRPEIAAARARGEGTSERTMTTLRQPRRYFALRIDEDGKPIGFIRSALPLASIEAQRAAARRLIWGLVGASCLMVLGLAYWIVGQIVQPIASLIRAAEAMSSGDYQHRVYVENRDELGELAGTFNRMSQELHGRMNQLSQTSDRQATVLGGMIEGVIAVDARQKVVLANEAAGRLFDFRAASAEGRPLLEVVRNHAVRQAVTSALTTRKPQRLETKTTIQTTTANQRHPASSPQHIDIHVQPLPGEPCPGVVLVMHDTTELRRLESLRRDFVANVSHELKTPLSSIKAYTETLRNGAMNDPQTSQRFLARIEEQSDRLHHLIMDMLMLARIESDQQVFDIVAVDVAAVVASCFETRRPAADAKHIELKVPSGQPACRVRADQEGLREILDNLIDNAIKYTPNGGTVTVSWECRGPTSKHLTPDQRFAEANTRHPTPDSSIEQTVIISVADTGIGIKPDDQRRVFERFYRVDKARSRELGGTGLGLAIVKHLAQSFGGKVAVTSEPGHGSTFTVELPLA
jgi:two-component system phosphate regulon sensor histidine kinase PhoR